MFNIPLERTDVRWNDFRFQERDRIKSPRDIVREFQGRRKLFEVLGNNVLAISLDCLHTLDLGVSLRIVGSSLWDILAYPGTKLGPKCGMKCSRYIMIKERRGLQG